MRDYQHIRFCCTATCARLELKELAQAMAISPIKVDYTDFTLSIPGYRWRFFPGGTTMPERLFGSIVDSYDFCEETPRLHPALVEYLKTHLGREKF